MLVASSFDLWQKDTFFSAAEEVQDSADIMESAYRTWVSQRREGLAPQDLNELCRELQTALSTAKWQLDEFERAVRLSYRNRADDVTTHRHRQFVAAIENQISRVDVDLKESFNEDGKQPLRWVNLDEQERDELAMFLSGTPVTSQSTGDGYDSKLRLSTKSSLLEKQSMEQKLDLHVKFDSKRDVSKEVKGCKHVTSHMEGSYVIELETNESSGTSDGSGCQADRKIGTRRTWSSPNIGALKITIDAENEEKKALMLSVETTPKEKGSKPVFWKSKCGDHPQAKGGILFQTPFRGIDRISHTGLWKSETSADPELAKKMYFPTYSCVNDSCIFYCAFCNLFDMREGCVLLVLSLMKGCGAMCVYSEICL